VGYSRGAEALPFMTSRLPPDLKERVRLVALLGAARSTTFEFHLTDWLGRGERGSARASTGPEIEKLRGLRVLCVYGTDEKDSVCPSLPAGLTTSTPVQGGHHFGGDYRDLAARILRAAQGD
jgi:type IV secretory pathway VirJ component